MSKIARRFITIKIEQSTALFLVCFACIVSGGKDVGWLHLYTNTVGMRWVMSEAATQRVSSSFKLNMKRLLITLTIYSLTISIY
jgi:hypothetical protein